MCFTGFSDIVDARGKVGDEEREEKNRDPDVYDRVIAEEFRVPGEIGDRVSPDLGAIGAGEEHDCASEYEALWGDLGLAKSI